MTLLGLHLAAKAIDTYKSNLGCVLTKANELLLAAKEEALDILNADVFVDQLLRLTEAKSVLSCEAEGTSAVAQTGNERASLATRASKKVGAAFRKGRALATGAVAAPLEGTAVYCKTVFASARTSRVLCLARNSISTVKKAVFFVTGCWRQVLTFAGLAGRLAAAPIRAASRLAKRILKRNLAIISALDVAYWTLRAAASVPWQWRQAVEGKQDQSFKLVEQHAGTEDLGLETFDCIPQQLPFVVAVSQVVLTDVDAVCAIIISAATPFGEPLVEASLVFEPPIPCAQL